MARTITTLILATVFLAAPAGIVFEQNAPSIQTYTVEAQSEQEEGSGFWDFIPSLDDLLAALGSAVLSLFGLLLAIAGAAFNASLQLTVVDMGSLLGGGGDEGIQVAWGILRDLANIFFIGILVYIGITTILQVNKVGWEQLLVRVIIAALLVNFSLFFTQIIIDGTNLMAVETYDMITSLPEATDCDLHSEITCAFMEQFQLTSLYNTSGNPPGGDGTQGGSPLISEGDTAAKIFQITAFGSIFLLIAAFIFLAAALMFVTRFVILVFLMIISPIAFAAMALPQTEGKAKEWWKTLISQGIFAPLFLLFVWASLKVMVSLGAAIQGDRGTSFATALTSPDTDAAGIFVNFAIVAGLLFASLIMAKKLGIHGASTAVSYGKKFGGMVTAGAAGRAIRTTVGRGASAVAGSEWLKDRAGEGGLKGMLARGTQKGARKTAKSSFDLRNVGDLGKQTGTGKGIKGGYDDVLKQQKKSRADYAKEELGSTKRLQKDYEKAEQRTSVKNLDYRIADAEREGNEEQKADLLEKRRQKIEKKAGEEEQARSAGRRKSYANVLETEKSVPAPIPPLRWKVARKNKEAGSTVRKELNKSKEQRAIDALKEYTSEQVKEDQGGTQNSSSEEEGES